MESAAKRTYVVHQGWMGGWDVVCMAGTDPLYVIDHCTTEKDARALAATYTRATR